MRGGIGPVSGLTLAGILYATEFAVSYSRIPVNAGFLRAMAVESLGQQTSG